MYEFITSNRQSFMYPNFNMCVYYKGGSMFYYYANIQKVKRVTESLEIQGIPLENIVIYYGYTSDPRTWKIKKRFADYKRFEKFYLQHTRRLNPATFYNYE